MRPVIESDGHTLIVRGREALALEERTTLVRGFWEGFYATAGLHLMTPELASEVRWCAADLLCHITSAETVNITEEGLRASLGL